MIKKKILFCASFLFLFTKDIHTKQVWPNGILQQSLCSWIILYSDNGFLLRDSLDQSKRRVLLCKTLIITVCNNIVFLNKQPIKQCDFTVAARSKYVLVNGILYRGIIQLSCHEDYIRIAIIGSKQSHQRMVHSGMLFDRWQLTAEKWHRSQVKLAHKLYQVFNTCKQNVQSITVRVLLDEQKNTAIKTWELISYDGFIVSHSLGLADKVSQYNKNKLLVQMQNGNLYINKKYYLGNSLYIQSRGEFIIWQGKPYRGSFYVTKQNDKILLCNYIELEDYICAVIRSESWPGWPVEVNKAFAIASRSYVIAMIMRSRKKNLSYDIKDTNEHQRYNLYGIHNSKIVTQAVKETQGVFLAHNNQPILAMFDSCCGGIVPSHIADFDFDLAPYLSRDYACTHCRRCSIYSWQVEYDRDIFEQLMLKEAHILSQLCDINVMHDKAGLVQEAQLKGLNRVATVSGKKLYSLLKEVKSFCFSVSKEKEKIIVKGRGFGHHLGMCQWGAREMVRDGWNYKQILEFYYPNTVFMRLT